MSESVSRHRMLRWHPNLIFWLLFGTLNVLLFLPLFLFSRETSSALPTLDLADGDLSGALSHLFLWRDNLDALRISVEFTLLTTLWLLVRQLRGLVLRWLIIGFYLLALAYAIYEAIVVSIYLSDPVFYSQYFLARDGLPFLASHLETGWWLYLAASAGAIAVVALLIWLLRLMLRSAAAAGVNIATRAGMALLAALCLVAIMVFQRYTAQPEMVVSSLGYKLQQNVTASLRLQAEVARFDHNAVQIAYRYPDVQLAETPDIYLIAIESYGSVLYKRPDFLARYTALLDDVLADLSAGGWHSATALSDSPTWGGGSWLAYTSLLFGLRIDNHPQYLSLMKRYQAVPYPNLGRALQMQGYRYVWLSSLVDKWDDAAWARYLRFHGPDDVLRYEDLGFQGPRYGWGPAPPDQYVLNYADEYFRRGHEEPQFFFTITQNSHYPWTPHPELVEEWRTLNEPRPEAAAVDPDTIEHATMRENYITAIEYQLPMLADFILRHDKEHDRDSIFILVGDHQPPAVSRRADGWNTPMHIIARDQRLIDSLAAYGFVSGLRVEDLTPAMRHEGFYSMIMRVLLDRYGGGDVALPEYLPNGVNAPRLAQVGR